MLSFKKYNVLLYINTPVMERSVNWMFGLMQSWLFPLACRHTVIYARRLCEHGGKYALYTADMAPELRRGWQNITGLYPMFLAYPRRDLQWVIAFVKHQDGCDTDHVAFVIHHDNCITYKLVLYWIIDDIAFVTQRNNCFTDDIIFVIHHNNRMTDDIIFIDHDSCITVIYARINVL